MTIVRVGTNQKFSQGWETAFGKGKKSAGRAAQTAPKKATAKKKSAGTAKKASAKKGSAKKKPAGKKKKR